MLDETASSLSIRSVMEPLPGLSPEKKPLDGRFCLYLSGATGGKHTAEPIGAALKTVYGEENVLALPSIVSIDPQDRRKKYPALAETLFKQMGENKRVTIVAFSGGPIELVDIIAAMKAQNPKAEEWAKNLEIVLMSPAGIMKGARETLRFLRHLGAYVKETRTVGPTQGIASLFLDPPDRNILSAQHLESAVEIAMPERRQNKELTESVSFDDIDFKRDENMARYVDEEAASAAEKGRDFKKEKQELDTRLKIAIEKKDKKLITALLRERGQLYAQSLKKAYDSLTPETRNPLAAAKIYSQMLLGLAHFSKLAYTGKVVTTINEIREKGAGVSLITPDLDPVFSLKDALNFEYARQLTGVEDVRTAIVGLGLSSHDSWVMNPKVLAEALRALHQRNLG